MTKMKKLFAVVLALAMLLTMSSLSAFAATTTVDMTVSAVANEILVEIDAEDNVGGLTATLTYDKNVVKYVGFASSNEANQEVNTLKDDKNGNVAIVLLGNDLTVKFEAIGAAGAVEFALDNIKASNADGTELLTADRVTAQLQAVITKGNTIRETQVVEKQDLGFVSSFIGSAVPVGATDVKLGFVALPQNMLDKLKDKDPTTELTIGTPNALNAEVAVTREALVSENATKFVAHIAGIADNTTRMGRVICGRFYVSYKIGGETKIFYSNNTQNDPAVTDGVVAKSFVGTCKAMAAVILSKDPDESQIQYGFGVVEGVEGFVISERKDVEDIIGGSTNEDQRRAILEFVIANVALLK